jgi:hypothetical protein
LAALGWILLASSARADTIIYNNTTTPSGHILNGGATEINGDDVTAMLANEITVAAGCGGASISGFTFGVANFSGSTVTAYVLLSFYSNNGPSGGPGAFLGGYSEEITNLTTATRTTFTASGLTGFNVPASGTFWVGITFDDTDGGRNSATGATAAQLNGLGVELTTSPVTVGSNQNYYFLSSAANPFIANNPSGSDVTPTDPNFEISLSTPAPEPGTGMLSLLAALPVATVGLIRRRRRAKG